MESYLCSKAELLADHIQACIQRGELPNPLPNIRQWSVRLGVSHGTLESALGILKQRGLLESRPRKGIYIKSRQPRPPPLPQLRQVRWIALGRQFHHLHTAPFVMDAISRRLAEHGIRLSLDICDANRLKALPQQVTAPHEMLLLHSLPQEYVPLFEKFRDRVLMLDLPYSGTTLSYITVDVVSAFRHATYWLVRRGFQRVTLLANASGTYPVERDFAAICAQAPHPVQGDVVRIPDELLEQNAAIVRLANRISPGHGLICNSPVPFGALMMALVQRGLELSGQVEVLAVNTMPVEIRTVPVPRHYPYPLEAFARAVCHAVLRFFERGSLPPIRKMIPLTMVEPPPLMLSLRKGQ